MIPHLTASPAGGTALPWLHVVQQRAAPPSNGSRASEFALDYLPHFDPSNARDDPGLFTAAQVPATTTAAALTRPPDPFRLTFEGRTVADWIDRFGQAIWSRTRPGAPEQAAPALIRQNIVERLGGRSSAQGRTVSRQFGELHRYLTDLAAVRDRYLAAYPARQPLVNDAADALMRSACSRLSHGLHDAAPGPVFTLRMDALMASADKADRAAREQAAREAAEQARVAAQQAELRIRQQVLDIEAFWIANLDGTEEWLKYALNGDMIFDSVEDMEKYCPAGAYVTSNDPLIDRVLRRGEIKYWNSGIERVLLRDDAGQTREVAFRGPTWAYADEDPEHLREQRLGAHPNLHANTHWNPDPRILKARIDGSRLARER